MDNNEQQSSLYIKPISINEKDQLSSQNKISRKVSKKMNNPKQQIQKKNSTSIISFFKIAKARSQQKKLKQQKLFKNNNQSYQQQRTINQEEEIIKRNLQNSMNNHRNQGSQNDSQIGSQYGDYNYDHQLHQVMRNHKKSPRQVYNTHKVIFRVATCQNQLIKTDDTTNNNNQNSKQNHKQYERFQKFKTQTQEYNQRYQVNNQKLSPRNFQQMLKQSQYQQNKYSILKKQQDLEGKNGLSIKQKLRRYENVKYCTQPIEDNGQLSMSNNLKYRNNNENVFGNFLHIINKKASTGKYDDHNKQIAKYDNLKQTQKITQMYSHRRSRTQHQQQHHLGKNIHSNREEKQSQKIFQNYKKLKQTLRRVSSKYKQREKNNSEFAQPKRKNCLNHHGNLDGNKNNNKQDIQVVFENIISPSSKQQFLTTRAACLTPKNTSKSKLNEVALRKMILNRQKQFFNHSQLNPNKNNTSMTNKAESPIITFQQIKSRLAKIQENQITKRHNNNINNKSLKIINNGSKQHLLSTKNLLMGLNAKKSQQEEKVLQNKNVPKVNSKMKICLLKCNGIKKHTDVYERHMRRKIMAENLSQEITPKISRNLNS